MKTATVEVTGLISPLSAIGIEKELSRLRGVMKVEVNDVAGTATVICDEAITDLKKIKAEVDECGYHCAGEVLPKDICTPEDPLSKALEVVLEGNDHPVFRPAGNATLLDGRPLHKAGEGLEIPNR